MSAGEWLGYGGASLVVMYLLVRSAAAGDETDQERGERPLFGDETDEEGS
jgi:hypothetical protein